MAIEFRIPDLGENIDSADVGQILVKEGDTLAPGKNVLELETEKAVFEVECPHGGKVGKIHVKPGDAVAVGTLVLTIETDSSASPTASPAAAPPAAPATKPTPPPPTTSAPATKPLPAKPTPAVNGEVAPPALKPPAADIALTSTASPATSPEGQALPAPAAPATRRLARELGVDIHDVKGSANGGRITQDDVRAFVKNRMQSVASASDAGPVTPALPDFSDFGPVERVRMSKLNLTAVNNLTVAWQTVPHVTQHDLADVTELEAARRRLVADPKYTGAKITMTVVAVKACVAALKAFPNFNASYDAKAGEIVHKRYFNIGIAVDTENGLLVPVVKHADQKTIAEIAQEITELSEKARNRKLDIASMKGGSFTISNLGGIGGTGFTPIVNWPEVAILGMSRSTEQPRLVDGKLENRLYLPLSLSYDHRVINGADAARFTRKLVELLADPFSLLIET
jgi:pyruvate dehydrogenase E2 component (dihydrolipoamide acetyltransferase)